MCFLVRLPRYISRKALPGFALLRFRL
ncbi:hypothetical protein CHELA40_15036 [Chelatococcus asaccharovorans]|nr:hypothetical protein CHELA17_60584 [Chelatococcus asaccharovorans]CAH1681292.1 hypothetical protein CHELA40_15036 [Chelatococcus asaccharovorans]